MVKLVQNSSGAHRAQGRKWLGVSVGGRQDLKIRICSKVRNLGCGGGVKVLDKFQI